MKAGIAIVLRALEAPIRQIVENGGVEGSVVVGKILNNKSETYGFNAQTEEFGDMLQAGTVDPAKVVRSALQGAASVAGLLIPPRPWWPTLRARDRFPQCQAVAAWVEWAAWAWTRLSGYLVTKVEASHATAKPP